MGKSYSLDLRQRVVGYVAAGRSCRAVGRVFGVSASTAVRIVSEHRSRWDVSPKPQGRPAGWFGKLAPHMDLPPYSPDLNPIEMAFAKLKAHLRRIGARTFDTLIEALGNICHLFKPEECRNFLKAAEYTSQ